MYITLRILILFFASFISFSALANSVNEEKQETIHSSFLLMEKKQWNEALLKAKEADDEALQTLVYWQYLLEPDSTYSFNLIKDFLDKHPDFPEQKKLRARAEALIYDSDLSDEEIIDFFSTQTPITGIGKLALVKALKINKNQPLDTIKSLIREAWKDGDFDESQEKDLLKNYGNFLEKADDIARIDKLIWEGKTTQAQRMFIRVGDDYKKLYQARIALQKDEKDAISLLSKVPTSLLKDSGLMFDRMRFRDRKDSKTGVLEILLSAPKKIPFPEKWWKYREEYIREAMAKNQMALAERLLSNHGQVDGQSFAEASWLKGRLLLEKKQGKEAYKIFTKMFEVVKYPVSKARAAYWAARAARIIADEENAKKWFKIASQYPTSFYGQVASLVHNGTAPLKIPDTTSVNAEDVAKFNDKIIIRAAKICLKFNQPEIAAKLINHFAENSKNPKDAVLVSELGKEAEQLYINVRAAKKALQNNIVLIEAGFPKFKTPENLPIERALVLAITRQESEFNSLARSPAGALGLMQLLPTTARETAEKNDLNYRVESLYDPDYNMQIGSLYLGKLIDKYDGSLPMAIAAYNAGMGNVYKWKKEFGIPTKTIESAIDWIEKIPFAETRNYVQRVLENLQIYRHIDETNQAKKLKLETDLAPDF